MIKRSNILVLALSLASASVLAAPQVWTTYEQAEIDLEVQSCLAEIGDHADYAGATAVRHEVTVSDRRGIGHRLDIRTSVYSDDGDEAIRAYATKCLVYRDNTPARFEIAATEAGARGLQ